jgi:putative membrane protein
MMRILIALIGNTFALLLTQAVIREFVLSSNFFDVLILALVLTALNFFLKPILKLLFGPIILLTLGFGALIVNMIILYILDILSGQITILGNYFVTLFLASLIVGVVNIVIHWSRKT